MDAHQQALLQSTHDSTIRQESMIASMQMQLSDGQARFKAIDLRFTVVEGEILEIKKVTEPTRKARKTVGPGRVGRSCGPNSAGPRPHGCD